MTFIEVTTAVILILGVIFFAAGSVGVVRFKGAHSRLHALSKADNLGLGLISLGCLLASPDTATAVKKFFIRIHALYASAVNCFIISEMEMSHGDNSKNL